MNLPLSPYLSFSFDSFPSLSFAFVGSRKPRCGCSSNCSDRPSLGFKVTGQNRSTLAEFGLALPAARPRIGGCRGHSFGGIGRSTEEAERLNFHLTLG